MRRIALVLVVMLTGCPSAETRCDQWVEDLADCQINLRGDVCAEVLEQDDPHEVIDCLSTAVPAACRYGDWSGRTPGARAPGWSSCVGYWSEE